MFNVSNCPAQSTCLQTESYHTSQEGVQGNVISTQDSLSLSMCSISPYVVTNFNRTLVSFSFLALFEMSSCYE